MGGIEKKSDLNPMIDAICKKIADVESKGMQGGIETIGDYGFKCAKSAFTACLDICFSATRIQAAIEGEDNENS